MPRYSVWFESLRSDRVGSRRRARGSSRSRSNLTLEVLEERTLLDADLAILVDDTSDPVVAGTSYNYSLKVTNNGPAASPGATITDTLPAGLTFNAGGSDPGCSAIGQNVTCFVAGLPNATFTTLTIAVDVASSVPNVTVKSNTATVVGDDPDPVSGNNSNTETTTIIRAIDLTVLKADSSDPVIAGTSFDYTVLVTNNGPSDATGVVVTDTLPAGLTFNAGGSSVECQVLGQDVTCTIGSLTDGSLKTLTIAVDVASSVADSTLLSNTATVVGNEIILTNEDDSSTETTTVNRETDLSIVKSDSSDPVLAGTSFSYSLQVTNNGPSDATGVTVVDTLPAGTTFHAAGSSAGCSALGLTVTCIVGGLTDGSQTSLTIVVDVASSVVDGAILSNTASVSGNETDPTAGNDSDSENTTVNREADLAIVKDDSADPVIAGTSFSYSIELTNNGPSDASGVTVTDTLPAGLTFDPVNSSLACSAIGQDVTCTVGVLTDGSQTTLTIAVDVSASVPHGTLLSNTATVAGNETDPTAANDSSTETTTINRIVDLSITKDDSSDPVIAGTSFTYSIGVTNNGPLDATGVTVTDTLPAGLTFSAVGSSAGCSAIGQAVTCTIGALANSASTPVTIAVDVSSSLADGATLSNTASVAGVETDPTPGNNSSTELTDVAREADLSVSKDDSADPITAGNSFSYSVLVTNNGPSDASGVVVTDTLPAGLTFVSAGSTAGCTAVGVTVTCNVGNLADGANTTLTIVVSSASSIASGAVLSNTVQVDGTETDPTAGNDTDTETTTVNRRVDLTVTKNESTNLVIAGSGAGNLTYTITVTNNGPSNASGITLSEDMTLPTGVTVDSATPSQGTFVNTTAPDGTWTVGALASGANATLTIVLTVAASTASGTDVISDTATVTAANETLINTTDDSDTESTSVAALDFGDAPDPLTATAGQYPTLLANNGARHVLGSGLTLGATVDGEADGQQNASATGDDTNGTDDEDGVVLPATIIARLGVTATVTASGAGKLDAWVDFDRDGIFEAGEQVATSLTVAAGANTLTFNVPSTASAGQSFARFRLSSAGGLAPTGQAADGEVEDYGVQIAVRADCTATVSADPDVPGQSMLVVVGTSGNDKITLKPKSGNTLVTVKGPSCNVNQSIAPASFTRVAIFGGSGDDNINTSKISNRTSIFGEAGNDTIKAGGGLNILVGGAGTDNIQGGAARDVIIGGAGGDSLRGNGGDDLLAAGNSDHDANDAALMLIMEEWRGANSYAVRVNHISGATAGGANQTFLLNATTVHDDAIRDTLRGDANDDWFLSNSTGGTLDTISDRNSGLPEIVTDL